jgi:hypothetical protein
MWSGPRNISTAMMRAWGNRPDTIVCDEPLYAHYLQATGRAHRGADEVIAAGPTDLQRAIDWLLGPLPEGKTISYQKHMAHHLLPDMDRGWLRGLSNCFLIRSPREVIGSLVQHLPDAALPDTGFAQQAELFDLVRDWTGQVPPVVDARDVLDEPRAVLTKLCQRLGVEFSDRMLSWEPGMRDTDGIWAKYWYKEVETTTSFQPYKPKPDRVPPHMEDLVRVCEGYYRRLYDHRITP